MDLPSRCQLNQPEGQESLRDRRLRLRAEERARRVSGQATVYNQPRLQQSIDKTQNDINQSFQKNINDNINILTKFQQEPQLQENKNQVQRSNTFEEQQPVYLQKRNQIDEAEKRRAYALELQQQIQLKQQQRSQDQSRNQYQMPFQDQQQENVDKKRLYAQELKQQMEERSKKVSNQTQDYQYNPFVRENKPQNDAKEQYRLELQKQIEEKKQRENEEKKRKEQEELMLEYKMQQAIEEEKKEAGNQNRPSIDNPMVNNPKLEMNKSSSDNPMSLNYGIPSQTNTETEPVLNYEQQLTYDSSPMNTSVYQYTPPQSAPQYIPPQSAPQYSQSNMKSELDYIKEERIRAKEEMLQFREMMLKEKQNQIEQMMNQFKQFQYPMMNCMPYMNPYMNPYMQYDLNPYQQMYAYQNPQMPQTEPYQNTLQQSLIDDNYQESIAEQSLPSMTPRSQINIPQPQEEEYIWKQPEPVGKQQDTTQTWKEQNPNDDRPIPTLAFQQNQKPNELEQSIQGFSKFVSPYDMKWGNNKLADSIQQSRQSLASQFGSSIEVEKSLPSLAYQFKSPDRLTNLADISAIDEEEEILQEEILQEEKPTQKFNIEPKKRKQWKDADMFKLIDQFQNSEEPKQEVKRVSLANPKFTQEQSVLPDISYDCSESEDDESIQSAIKPSDFQNSNFKGSESISQQPSIRQSIETPVYDYLNLNYIAPQEPPNPTEIINQFKSPKNLPQISPRGLPDVFRSPIHNAGGQKSKLQEARNQYKMNINRQGFEDIDEVIKGITNQKRPSYQYDEQFSLESTMNLPTQFHQNIFKRQGPPQDLDSSLSELEEIPSSILRPISRRSTSRRYDNIEN